MHNRNKKQITRSNRQNDITCRAPMLNVGSHTYYFLHFYKKCGMKEVRREEMLTAVVMITTLHKPINTPHNTTYAHTVKLA
jgi:hypothetical protein